MVYFAYLGTRRLRSVTASRSEARRHLAVEKLLSDYRGRFDASFDNVWCNLPPARVWDLRRSTTPGGAFLGATGPAKNAKTPLRSAS